MNNTSLEDLSIRIITEYYRNNIEPALHYIDENIIWVGPRLGQLIRGREELTRFFREAKTDLTFELGDIQLYDVSSGTSSWEILLIYEVVTRFPDGTFHVHHQRLHYSWTLRRCPQPDGTSRRDFRIIMVHISNAKAIEAVSLYAQSAADSATDALYVHDESDSSGHRCVLRGRDGSSRYFLAERILYIESTDGGRHTAVHTEAQTIPCMERLSQIQEEYGDCFLRPHISYLVNPLAVDDITRFRLTLKNSETLPIPEKRFTAFRSELNRWFLR